MRDQPMLNQNPCFNFLSDSQRYGIQDAINAILRLHSSYMLDVEPLSLKRELDLEIDDYDFTYITKKLITYSKELKKIDDYLNAKAKKEATNGE